MPLISCPECGRTVSDAAPVCPGCGVAIAPPRREGGSGLWVGLAAGAGLVLLLAVPAAIFWARQHAAAAHARRTTKEELVDFVEVDDSTPPVHAAPSVGAPPVAPAPPPAGGPSRSKSAPAPKQGDWPEFESGRSAPPELDEGAYELSAVDTPPELTNAAEVSGALAREYPPLLRDAGMEGSAVLRMRVGANGRVQAGSVSVESATDDRFAVPARNVASKLRFRPAKIEGRAVPVWVTLPITFQLAR